ncbi:hypothetical protein DXG03_006066 [Asterophora parasitica]|uniref:DDT domain-containing protein n=1 Tax=Asterophora parasitica TaxID=117018 RepID=A0A9P7G158_9AGAR|nr:hypothetical protein DXG03_006066 [Asterophora parasitica]
MPRRVSARNAPPREESPPSHPAALQVSFSEALTQLRTHWKWAAFSQFFFTFNHLFAMNDVSLNAIEEDFVYGTNVVLPRIMQRLLYTVSYDRKVNLDNWQTGLRKQYRKRDPAANPIGPEPRVEEPNQPSSPPAEEQPEVADEEDDAKPVGDEGENQPAPSVEPDEDADNKMPESTRASTLERGLSLGASVKGFSAQPSEPDSKINDAEEQEESKNWLDLPMLVKLESMHLLTEWQFQNPTRLRTLMRNDDENASWRIEPIGYDSKSNAYWLIGADRLWLQRPLPRPPRPKASAASLKRKHASDSVKAAPKGRAAPAAAPATKKPRLQEESAGRGRAAKMQAKAKLDAQAKELAELNRQAAREGAGLRVSTRGKAASPAKKAAPTLPPPRGTRLSARLRGREDEDEWQSVPEEWLNGEGKKVNGERNGAPAVHGEKTGLESDGSEISDLTELSDSGEGEGDNDQDEGEQAPEAAEEQPKEEEAQPQLTEAPAVLVDDRELDPPPVLPADFIEWETICVTLYEWEHIAERFEKATHYTEKALYKVLTRDIVPVITEELREFERKQKLDTAMNQRKRSSRLLIRQSEKEEAEAAERKRREEEERNGRARRQEARAKKEEAERERREMARELRRREREEREERDNALTDVAEAATSSEMQVDVIGNGHISDQKHSRQPRKDAASYGGKAHAIKAGGSGSRTPVGEDWELDCEICNRRGINLVGDFLHLFALRGLKEIL